MMEYIYRISMTWNNTDPNTNEKESIQIDPSSILFLVMENDYENSRMPTLFCKLNMDKSDIDKIVQNAKTAEIDLIIYKEEKSSDPAIDQTAHPKLITQYSGTMSYFIKKDINYNKEIDYGVDGENPDEEVTGQKKKVNESFSIGLMFKNCIEYNKQTNNMTIMNTTPFNAILYFMQGMPLLIEPFTYNEEIKQLIVPPQETLYDVIEFFNNQKVFYDTPYRFYMDPDCIYLMSSSGKPLKKKGETYDTVVFNIQATTTKQAHQPGLLELPDQSCYYIDLDVKNSVYNIDNDTTKKFNEFSTIIDPGKDNTILVLDSVSTTLNKITGITSDIKDTINKNINSISNIPSDLFDFRGILVDATTSHGNSAASAVNAIDRAITIINGLTQSAVGGDSGATSGPSEEQKQSAVAQLKEYRDSISKNSNVVNGLPGVYNATTTLLTDGIHDITNLTSYVDSVSSIDFGDNVLSMAKQAVRAESNIAENQTKITNELVPIINNASICSAAAKNAIIPIQNIMNTIMSVPGEDGTSQSGEGYDELKACCDTLSEASENMLNQSDTMGTIITKYKDYGVVADLIIAKINPYIQSFKDFNYDVKRTITNTISNVANIGTTAMRSLDNIVNSVKTIYEKAQSLDFSIENLDDLKKDINIVKDISKIGILGISKFDVDLNISGNINSIGTGTKILRVSNDNANMVKNEKAKIENKDKQLTLNKYDIDTSILTPNKQYIVNNYDAHKSKNGIFLLQRKIDMFTRSEEDVFTDNVQLEFDRLSDISTTTAGETSKTANKISGKDIEKIIDSAQKILNTTKNGVSLNDASSIVTEAQKIYDNIIKG